MASSTWLGPLLEPRSIAVVGASQRPGSFGQTTLAQALANGFKGEVYPVNPNYREVLGRTCHPSLADLPRAADLAVLAVANGALEEQVKLAIETGCRSVVIFASAYLEGDSPPLLPERLKRLAGDAKLPV